MPVLLAPKFQFDFAKMVRGYLHSGRNTDFEGLVHYKDYKMAFRKHWGWKEVLEVLVAAMVEGVGRIHTMNIL